MNARFLCKISRFANPKSKPEIQSVAKASPDLFVDLIANKPKSSKRQTLNPNPKSKPETQPVAKASPDLFADFICKSSRPPCGSHLQTTKSSKHPNPKSKPETQPVAKASTDLFADLTYKSIQIYL